MPKIENVYARLELRAYSDSFRLLESRYELNARLYEVLSDDFYLKKLTDDLVRLHPVEFEAWLNHKQNVSFKQVPSPVTIVALFAIMDQKVDLVDVRFY